ncbi:MAG: SpoIIE family protein phosphatase [Bacteroidales bacterium]|nr:SpoIIE family protein phosphatase [Bacteroidales bacterium]MBN2819015.1 SpoIIE family protein phosphatase [Bacteroidales bacterium]
MCFPFNIKLFIVFLTFTFWQVEAQNDYIIFSPSEQKLSEAYIYTINQGNNGYLWIGTSEGLYNYNGFTINAFTVKDSLADDFVTCSYNTSDGIWFGHMNGNISFYNGRYFKQYNLNIAEKSSITSITQSPDGKVWAGTYLSGLINLSIPTSNNAPPLQNEQITISALEFLSQEKFLVGSVDGLRFCRITEKGAIETLRYFTEIPRIKIISIVKQKSDSGIYVATSNDGIYKLINRDNSFTIKQVLKNNDTNAENIQTVIEDNKGDLWLGTFGQGILKLIYEKETDSFKLNKFTQYQGDNVKTLFEDRDGNIWAGSFGAGISKITSQPFSIKNYSDFKSEQNIKALFIDSKNKWLGTENALIKVDIASDKVISVYTNKQGLPNDEITSLYSNNENLFIGTLQSGVYILRISEENILPYPIHEGILENSITSITGKGNEIWIGSKKGVCKLNLATSQKNWYTINQGGLPHNSVNHIFIDSKNKIWITTISNTISCVENNTLKRINIPSNRGIVSLMSVVEDKQGKIWIGSAGQGVFLLHADSVLNISTMEGLFSDYCYSMLGDSNGYIWIGHRGGISRINTSDLSIKTIQKYAHLKSDFEFYMNSTSLDSRGLIWFGTNKGLVCYNPNLENSSLKPPIINFTSFLVNGQDTEIKEEIELPPDNYKLQFDFIGINLKEPDLVKYQYRLKGFDKDWSDITSNNSVIYKNISEGKYIFEVNASSGDGIVTVESSKVSIKIKTSPWKSFWPYIGIFLAVAVGIYLLIKRREYKHLVEKNILEQKVLERTLEIQRQKDELEAQQHLIQSKNKDITDSLKYARKIQSAITPPEELLNKILPDHFIINRPKDIVSGDFCWYTQADDKIIVTVADCTGHGVPGAIMSILGINSLNEIIINYGVTEPSRILELLRLKVITSLSQHSKESPSFDGINLGLCVIDQKNLTIQFSGAINNMVHIQKKRLNLIRADRIPIGVSDHEHKTFTNKEFQGKEGDVIYLFSDGFKDQFGGNTDKKFSNRKFINTLYRVHELSMDKQRQELEKILDEWMEGYEQTDDITVLGFKL